MLNDIWKRGIDIADISNQAGMKLPVVEISQFETVAKLADVMLKNGTTSVLITNYNKPVGVINDRDLLKEIVEGRKDPAKTLTRDINFTPLVILGRNESMVNAMKVMREKRFKRIAMVKDGQLVGMLTESVSKKKTPLPLKAPAS